jgi:hypothetical protein
MGTDKTDSLKPKPKFPLLSVLVVRSVVKISSKTPNPALIPASHKIRGQIYSRVLNRESRQRTRKNEEFLTTDHTDGHG